MNSFYGDVKNGTRVSLIFDKTYSNRKAMEAAISKLGGTVGNKNGDGIYNTRYVLIDYGEKRYCPYMSIKTVNATWYNPTTLLFNNKGPQLYIYNEQTASYLNVKSTDKYDKLTVYYVRMDGETATLDKSKVALTPDYIDENCEYYKNRKIDENEYNGAYHHTVWQKIWCSVGVNSTVTEKYIMVAELDAKAPQFNVIIDAPDDNDVYSLVSKRTSIGKRLPLDTNNLYYKKVNNEFVLASDEDVANWNNESIDYNNLTVKELFSSPLFRYSEISSDVYYYKPLETDDVNPTPFIKDQNSLDEYISRLGNIYRSSNYNLGEDKMTYEPVTAGMAYLKSNGIREVKYYYRTFSEDGIISETLFNRFKAADDVLYHKVNGVITAVTKDDIYDKTDKYLQRQPLMNGMGPHVDPIRSTDLDYKLHLPRNWKFNTDSDLDFNNAGFDPRKQSYTPNAKNKIFLKKEKSGAVYPVHMTKEGYIAFGADDETALNSIQIPDAGYYVNNELQYIEQIDQRKFDFVLPEFGNMMSKLWDLIYPRGDWEQVTNPNYDDENYKNGNYYYKEGDYYQKVSPGDLLYPDKTYWIFIPADDDSTDANRYVFIGNDRDPADYPKTIAELIRYIYALLGLETDNNYRDYPSKNTIWGMFNGFLDLFGTPDDISNLNHFIPLKSELSADVNGTTLEQVFYGPAGYIDYGHILTEKTFNTLNENALGPLYVMQRNYPIWEEVDTSKGFQANLVYYILENGQYKHIDITSFESGVNYYTAFALYEKATYYSKDLYYFRNVNSLWSLLREFQDAREKYQVDWTENIPGSPQFIQNKPHVIYASTDDIQVSHNDLPLLNSNEYKQLLNITSQTILDSELSNLQNNQWITIYFVDGDGNVQYNKVITGDSYNSKAEYYLIDKSTYNADTHSIETLWENILISASDKDHYYDDDDAGSSTDLRYYTLTEILSIFDEEDKETLITSVLKGTTIGLDVDGNGIKNYRVLNKNGTVVKVLGMDDISTSQAYNTTSKTGTFTSGSLGQLYAGSDLDTYLNTTWYNTLSNTTKAAIVPESRTQYMYACYDEPSTPNTTTYTYQYQCNWNDSDYDNASVFDSILVGNRNVFALDLKDIYDYFGKVCITSNELMKLWTNQTSAIRDQQWWLSSATESNYSSDTAWNVNGDRGLLDLSTASRTFAIRPAFNLDLSKIDFEIIE